MLDCLNCVPNRGACVNACLSGNVTRSFREAEINQSKINILIDFVFTIKALRSMCDPQSQLLKSMLKCQQISILICC